MSYHDGYRDGLKDAGQDSQPGNVPEYGLNPIVVESGALAIAGVAGMYADLIKKTAYHGHTLDWVKARQMVGEIGRLQKQALAWLDSMTQDGGEQ